MDSPKSPFCQLQKPTSCYQQDLFQVSAYQVTYILPHLLLCKDAVKLQGGRSPEIPGLCAPRRCRPTC